MVKLKNLTLATLIKEVSGELVTTSSDTSFPILEIGEPLEVGPQGLAFLISESFLKDIAQCKAGVLVCQKSLLDKIKPFLSSSTHLVVCEDAYLALAETSRYLAAQDPFHDWDVDSTSSKNFEAHPTAQISERAVLSTGVKVGARSRILPGAMIGPHCQIGEDCVIFPGVVLYPYTELGHRVRIHANTVLGSDGFGYAKSSTGPVKIWHLGRVRIGNNVEIGAGTTVDKGTIKDTVIEFGAKIDNQVQIGHNGLVKSFAILCSQTGLSGGVTVGRGAILAGQAGIADKLEIGDGAIIGPKTGLSKDVKPGEIMMGSLTASPRRQWWKLAAYFEKLPEIFDRLKKLEKKIEKLG